MSMTIHKYQIFHQVNVVDIDVPVGAEILSVQMQGRSIVLWAIVDDSAPIEKRSFTCYFTGEELGATVRGKHVGTVQMPSGYVVHVFETTEPTRNETINP